MKKHRLVLTITVLLVALACNDAVGLDLPPTWSDSIKSGAEKMIAAGIGANQAVALTTAMTQVPFDEKSILLIQKAMIEAHSNGLPDEQMQNKIHEGIAKRASPPMIVSALNRIADRYAFSLNQARRLASREADTRGLGHILRMGMAAGLSRQDAELIVNRLLHRLGQMPPTDGHSLAEESFLTARDLARQGVSSITTAEVIEQALQKGFNSQEMKSMRAALMAHSPRTSLEHLAKNMSKAIQQGKNPQNAINRGQSGQNSTSSGGSPGSGSGGGSGDGSGPGGSGGEGSGSGSGNGPGGGGGSGGPGGGGPGGSGPGGGPGGGGPGGGS